MIIPVGRPPSLLVRVPEQTSTWMRESISLVAAVLGGVGLGGALLLLALHLLFDDADSLLLQTVVGCAGHVMTAVAGLMALAGRSSVHPGTVDVIGLGHAAGLMLATWFFGALASGLGLIFTIGIEAPGGPVREALAHLGYLAIMVVPALLPFAMRIAGDRALSVPKPYDVVRPYGVYPY